MKKIQLYITYPKRWNKGKKKNSEFILVNLFLG